MGSFCRKPHIRQKSGSRDMAQKRSIFRKKVPFFDGSYLGNQWSKLKSVLIFWKFESSSFPNGPTVFTIFAPLCRKSRLNISPNFGEKSGFSNISSLDRPIKLKLCSQLEDHKGWLEWRFQVDCIFGFGLMVLGPKIWVPILVFRFSRVWVVGFAPYCAVS